MNLRIDDWIQENLFFLGNYEHAELKLIEQDLQKDSIFIDIGANIGLYTLYASKFIDETGKIISFEPFSSNYKALTQNISLNRLSAVRIEQMAIGEKDGTIDLYYNDQEKNLGMVSTIPLEVGIKEPVKMTSLDIYLKNESFTRIDLIKIDIEGFEYSALLGMKDTLAMFHPSVLIELWDGVEQTNNREQCELFLTGLGYEKYFIDDGGHLTMNESNPERKNYFFTTKKDLLTIQGKEIT